jgi:hypothetical protein
MPPRGKEKRRHDRVEERVTLQTLAGDFGTIEMETANLSLGGAYCLSTQAIPPMTQLHLNIFLPSTDGRAARRHYPIEVEAVVVRSEKLNGHRPAPDGNGHPGPAAFRLALFFAGMKAGDREDLARFLSARSEA